MRYLAIVLVVPLMFVAAHVDAQSAAPAAASGAAGVSEVAHNAQTGSSGDRVRATTMDGRAQKSRAEVAQPRLNEARVMRGAALKADAGGCALAAADPACR